MDNNEFLSETIELSLPANAAYVSAARLTASSIANRMNFDIDEIEDIKYAVSEACTFLIKKSPDDNKSAFKIKFTLDENRLLIGFTLQTEQSFSYDNDEMSILMIRGLMDIFEMGTESGGLFSISIGKIHKEISFD